MTFGKWRTRDEGLLASQLLVGRVGRAVDGGELFQVPGNDTRRTAGVGHENGVEFWDVALRLRRQVAGPQGGAPVAHTELLSTCGCCR